LINSLSSTSLAWLRHQGLWIEKFVLAVVGVKSGQTVLELALLRSKVILQAIIRLVRLSDWLVCI